MEHILDWNKPNQRFFEELSQIPHGSYHEQAYSDYLVAFAKQRGLRYKQYEIGNVIIYKEASAGYEDHPTVALQAHMDMVWEKTPESGHNFELDPLTLYIEDGWLHAKGTTLGADDGTGISYMLSILDDKEAKHPALECIFTTQEEVGLFGAEALKPEDITARRLIGLDDGGGGVRTTVSSAGGQQWTGTWTIATSAIAANAIAATPVSDTTGEPSTAAGYRLTVGGLAGGHSGGTIHLEKGNSIKVLNRILTEIAKAGEIRIASIEAGSKDNAIPRDAVCVFATTAADAEAICEKMIAQIQGELQFSDAGVFAKLEPAEVTEAWSAEATAKFMKFLYVCPTGMRHKSMNIENLTVSSENLAVIRQNGDQIEVTVSLRSSVPSYLEEMAEELRILSDLFDIPYEECAYYPSWPYNPDSEMRKALKELVMETKGVEVVESAVHGGLECGLFMEKWPDMDIVTTGPNASGAHSPDEKLDLESFDATLELLKALISRL